MSLCVFRTKTMAANALPTCVAEHRRRNGASLSLEPLVVLSATSTLYVLLSTLSDLPRLRRDQPLIPRH